MDSHIKVNGKPGRPRRSLIWNYFIHDARTDMAICKEEECSWSQKGHRTSNLRLHLKRHHIGLYAELLESEGNRDQETIEREGSQVDQEAMDEGEIEEHQETTGLPSSSRKRPRPVKPPARKAPTFSSREDVLDLSRVNCTVDLQGLLGEMERFKQELLADIRIEFNEMKMDLIQRVRQELSNRR